MFNANSLIITHPMLRTVAEVDEFKGAWSAGASPAPQRLAVMRKIATVERVGSSTRLEGGRLSDREVTDLLTDVHAGPFAARDEQEAAGYAAALETVFASGEREPFAVELIRQLHRDLLKHGEGEDADRGSFKTRPNTIEITDPEDASLGTVFRTASPDDTPRLMEDLIGWFDQETDRGILHPLIILSIFTAVFLEIHPFQEGNGPLSRLLITLLLLNAGYRYAPYCSVESVIERHRDACSRALCATHVTIRNDEPDWEPWVVFILESLRGQVERLKNGDARPRPAADSPLPELSVRILDVVKGRGRASVADLVRDTGANRSTIKDHLRKLGRHGCVSMRGAGRGTWYAPS